MTKIRRWKSGGLRVEAAEPRAVPQSSAMRVRLLSATACINSITTEVADCSGGGAEGDTFPPPQPSVRIESMAQTVRISALRASNERK